MSTIEDDRKQRFRFHKNDEILLLQIVLQASPCPYKISSRDGAIMVAWNSIAEEFHSKCKPRPDGKLPLPRTCRTRCDKMITDYMAMRASPHLKNKKQESKEDRTKDELLEKLANLQGKVLGSVGIYDDDDDDGIGISNASSVGNYDTTGARSANLVTPGHLLAQGTSTGSSQINHHSQQHHQHQHQPQHHQQQQRNSASSLTQQSLAMVHNQSTSDLLATGLLMSTSGMSGVQGVSHQDTSDILSIESAEANQRMDRSKQQNSSSGARKRRGNNITDMGANAQHDLSSLDYMQRSSTSSTSASGQTQHANMLPNIAKRLKPTGNKHTVSNLSNTFMSNGHHPNSTRSTLGSIGAGLGSNLSGQELTGLNVGQIDGADYGDEEDDEEDEEEEDDDEDDGDNDVGFQDAREELGNDYDDDYGNENDIGDGDALDNQQLDSNSMLGFQNNSVMSSRNDSRAGGSGNSSAPIPVSKGKSRRGDGLQRYSSSGSVGSNLRSGLNALGGAINPGFLILSQMGPEDRKYVLRKLQLQEKKVQVEMDKVELERDRLKLERERLQWDMRMNSSKK
ncbi:hypothetical protein BGZ46_007312 [Entomortierella lignicola]|nr:hypothetical protein BGZ46_007312 [Entomortierella lignicola]